MNLNFCSKHKKPYQKLLAKKITKCSRLDIFKNLEIVNFTPLVTVTSYPPRPDRVAKMILKVTKENYIILAKLSY